MKKEILTRPFGPDQIKQRQGQHGKVLHYLATHAVIARLNEGCDAWGFEIVSHEIVDDEVIVVGKLVADGVTKMAFGGATITRDREGRIVDLGDTHKAAASDAIKKAASLFGVGLDLYRDGAPTTATRTPATLSDDGAPTPVNSPRITDRQLNALRVIVRRRGIGAAALTAMLRERHGRSALEQLSRTEASTLLTELGRSDGAAA